MKALANYPSSQLPHTSRVCQAKHWHCLLRMTYLHEGCLFLDAGQHRHQRHGKGDAAKEGMIWVGRCAAAGAELGEYVGYDPANQLYHCQCQRQDAKPAAPRESPTIMALSTARPS